MKRLFLTLALCLCALTPVWGAGVLILAQQPPAGNQTSLDGSAFVTNGGGSTTTTVTLSTTKANDLIVACFQSNTGAVTSVADTAGLTWTHLATANTMFVYYAYSTGILTSDVVTATLNINSTFNANTAFGINGVPSSGFLDAGGVATTITSTPPSITTTNANDFIFSCMGLNTSTGTAGSGWTAIPGTGGSFNIAEYQIVSATQSGLASSLTTGTIKDGIATGILSR